MAKLRLAAFLLATASAFSCTSAPRPRTIQVSIDALSFTPTAVDATVGDTIEWVNRDVLAHTATATSGDWNLQLPPKETRTLVLTKAGAFDYFCEYHPNMTGKLAIKA